MLNKVIIMGRLTRDPELRYTPSTGAAVARYSIAVDRNTKSGEVDFINIVAWGKNAEFASKYLKKGRLIAIEGRLQMNKWIDNNGQNRTTYEVIVESHIFIPGKKSDNQDNIQQTQQNDEDPNSDFMNIDVDEKDLPF